MRFIPLMNFHFCIFCLFREFEFSKYRVGGITE